MPVDAQNPQFNTPGNSTPPSSESYVAAAMEALKSAPPGDPAEPVLGETKSEPAPVVEDTKPTEIKTAEPKEEKKVEETKDEIDAPSDSLKKSFEKLAKGNAELRAQEARLKPLLAMADRLDPNSLSAIARAVQSGDPVSALAALGYSHHDYARAVANGRQAPREEAAEPDQSEMSPAEQRIARLEQQLADMSIEKGRAAAMKDIAQLGTDPAKFKFVARAGAEAHEKALMKLEDYFSRTGKMPAESRQESYTLALEAVEADYKKEATKWQRLLTDKPSMDSVVTNPGSTEFRPRGASETARQPFTNSTATAPRAAPDSAEPKTPEEFQRRAAQLLSQLDR